LGLKKTLGFLKKGLGHTFGWLKLFGKKGGFGTEEKVFGNGFLEPFCSMVLGERFYRIERL